MAGSFIARAGQLLHFKCAIVLGHNIWTDRHSAYVTTELYPYYIYLLFTLPLPLGSPYFTHFYIPLREA